MKTEAEIGVMRPQTQELHGPPAMPEAQRHGRFLPQSLQKALILPTPSFWISGLHNCENKFLLFKEPSLWYFVMTALGKYCRGLEGLRKKSRREGEGRETI